MAEKLKKRKKSLFIVAIIIILVVLAVIASSVFTRKNLDDLKGILSNLNPFAQEEAGEGGGSGEGESSTGEPTTIANENKNETIIGSGGVNPAETGEGIPSGSGKLTIVNWVNNYEFDKCLYNIVHYTGGTEGYGTYDFGYSAFFSPSGFNTKIISRITGYELLNDVRPVDSLSTIYLELSLHSQDGGAITIDSTNELRLSFPLESQGYNFTDKTITLQQYNPNNTGQSFPAYDVRVVIEEDNGIITLANLSGSYNSEEPYAYFRLEFS